MLEQMLKICEDKGLQKPSCYQGEYNVITRSMESELLPLLRAHDMAFNAFRYVLQTLLPDSTLESPSEKLADHKYTYEDH